ncbi:MAG: peptidoglycan DD-metalloendopeptidase family protein, partial [Endomicrobia bacterium]|nr:peptidoglycan DD-metalloendopeptidase family protein [Endomicrobiia bacterium]
SQSQKNILHLYSLQLRRIEKQINTISMLRQEYYEKKNKLNTYYNELISKNKQQKQLFIKKSELLNEYKQKQKQVELELAELQKTQKELENLLKKLKEKRKKEQIVKKQEVTLDRKFIKPVNGEVISKFGKELKAKDGSCIVRNGIILQGLSNENVVSIESGKVLFVSTNFRSYGKIIIIEHKDSVHSVYAQLGEIFVSENVNVAKNQIIGKTNSSGQLYFELRKNFVPVDPELYFE